MVNLIQELKVDQPNVILPEDKILFANEYDLIDPLSKNGSIRVMYNNVKNALKDIVEDKVKEPLETFISMLEKKYPNLKKPPKPSFL